MTTESRRPIATSGLKTRVGAILGLIPAFPVRFHLCGTGPKKGWAHYSKMKGSNGNNLGTLEKPNCTK